MKKEETKHIKRLGFNTDCCNTFTLQEHFDDLKVFIENINVWEEESRKVNFIVGSNISV